MKGKGRGGGKVPVDKSEDFGSSPFDSLVSDGLTKSSVRKVEPGRVREELKMGKGERLEVKREKSGRGGKTVTTVYGFPARVNRKMRTALLKEMKTSLGTGGTWSGDCMELQGDKREEVISWLGSEGFVPVRAGG